MMFALGVITGLLLAIFSVIVKVHAVSDNKIEKALDILKDDGIKGEILAEDDESKEEFLSQFKRE